MSVLLIGGSCSRSNFDASLKAPGGRGQVEAANCEPVSGTPWVPQVSGSAPSSSLENVERIELQATAPVNGIESTPQLVDFDIPMPEDLGEGGSLSLLAQVSGLPAGISGGAYPALVSLNDGQTELVGMRAQETAASCSAGYYCCEGQRCRPNPGWDITYPSMYSNREQWEQHQLNDFGYLSVNTFPTCNWEDGGRPCMLRDTSFFSEAKLRFGRTYRARYALIASDYPQSPGFQANLKLTVLRKKAIAGGDPKTVDLNFILVGQKNIAASRRPEGQRNLNALVEHVARIYGPAIRLGRVNVIEWSCEQGGEAYAELKIEDVPKLFEQGSAALPATLEARALNLFMVSAIRGDEPGFTFLGVSGGILGPMLNGTPASGLVFSSFNKLADFNPLCNGSADCPVERQQKDFVEMGVTISHEMGHFLGLNHPSESDGRRHDFIPDTPECTETESLPVGRLITIRSCRESSVDCSLACSGYNGRTAFCPEAAECQFNHLMWWTSKNFVNGKGDGNLLTADSSSVIQFNPFIR